VKDRSFFAVCPSGLEEVLAGELGAAGGAAIRAEHGGVAFTGPMRAAYAANLHSRIASRILWQVGRRGYSNEQHLYDATQEVRWQDLMSPQQTLRVDVTASRSPLRSLEFAMLRVKDGIVDRLRELTGVRPSISRTDPDVRVFAFLDATTVTLYVDLSGEPLFKRGWRAGKGEAPLKENLAAGLLALADWQPSLPLLDPFCGSGTIVIEAASIAARRAPGLNRRFAFERLKGFDSHAWRTLKDVARRGRRLGSGAARRIGHLDARRRAGRRERRPRGTAVLAGRWAPALRSERRPPGRRARRARHDHLESALRRAECAEVRVSRGNDGKRR
jgi:putative N6-adenine-specific DNA methylase